MSLLSFERPTPASAGRAKAPTHCKIQRVSSVSMRGSMPWWQAHPACGVCQSSNARHVEDFSHTACYGNWKIDELRPPVSCSMADRYSGRETASANSEGGRQKCTAEAVAFLPYPCSESEGWVRRLFCGSPFADAHGKERRPPLHPQFEASERLKQNQSSRISATYLMVIFGLVSLQADVLEKIMRAHGKEAQQGDAWKSMNEDGESDVSGHQVDANKKRAQGEHFRRELSKTPALPRRAEKGPTAPSTTITRDARETLEQTEHLALYMQHHQILPAHFFMVLLEIQGPYSVAECIKGSGGNVYDLKKKISDILVKLPTTTEVYVVDELEASPQLRQAALRALAVAQKDRQAAIGLEHFIVAILEIPRMRTLLQEVGTDVKAFLESVTTLYERKLENDAAALGKKKKPAPPDGGYGKEDLDEESVKQFGVDLTDMAKHGQISPVFGRNKEILEVVTVLTRKGKGNPCLIGEPGVGKTAVVEGLALRIIEGMTPRPLRDKRLFSVDLGALVAGASHRGEFEGRLKKLLNYVLKSNGRVILFIDEIHMLMGAGKSEGPMDAANLLKPYLARGEIRIVGATTQEEYKIIETDAALERRFKPVLVEEPPTAQAIIILQRIRPGFEKHHEMKISDEAITAAVLLSHKYIKHRKLPDKAIDLVDEACAAKRAEIEMEDKDGRQTPWRSAEVSTEPQEEVDVRRIQDQKHPAGIQGELMKVEKELEEEAQRERAEIRLSADDVAVVMSAWTGIPVGKMSENEKETVLHLAEILQQSVIGQQEASTAVADAMMRARAGLGREELPIGSFLFLGPPGVGKTELAKVLAGEVFHSAKRLIRIDMAEYSEQNSLSRLIGTSPGYVGFGPGGKLTEAVRRRPGSVVLFDEIEKGDRTILDILLQILDGGRLTDGKGVEVDFTSTIIILTSNVGAQYIIAAYEKGTHEGKRPLGHFDPTKESLETFAQAAGVTPQREAPQASNEKKDDLLGSRDNKSWKEEARTKVLDEVAASGLLRHEIVNRLSAVIIFEPISPANVKRIVMIQTKTLVNSLKAQHIEFAMDESAVDFIVKKAYSHKEGARPLKGFIDTHLEVPIARWLIMNWLTPGMRMLVTASKRYKSSLEAHVCVLVNGKCDLRTRKARILCTVKQQAGDVPAGG